MLSRRVVVVGTTSDYIDLIRRCYSGLVLFITDAAERARATEEDPGEGEEILADLTETSVVASSLRDHLSRHAILADGVACFDCESLELAAHLAEELALPFPSLPAVALTRNKFLSKMKWQDAKVACPQAAIARSPSETSAFLDRLGGPIVLKPLTGSGGELVFKCSGPSDCLSAYETIITRLSESRENRMYMPGQAGCGGFNPLLDIVLEEFIPGQEYSCDFCVEDGRVELVRIARKIAAPESKFGTTAAYAVPAKLPPEVPLGEFREHLHRAAKVLGLKRALCMTDFVVWKGKSYLLELAPRAGGDCLPWLIRQSSGVDMLKLALDFARGVQVCLPAAEDWESLVGLRLFAPGAGLVKKIDSGWLERDRRVREVFIKRRPGHRVTLPPADYDSRLLGHVIFKPSERVSVEKECAELTSKLIVEMETQP